MQRRAFLKRAVVITAPMLWLPRKSVAASLFNPAFVAGLNKPVSSAAPNNITSDVWQTFEFDTLDASNLAANDNATGPTWTVYGGAAISTSTSGNYNATTTVNSVAMSGTRGLMCSTQTAGTVQLDQNTYPTTHTHGVWVKIPTLASTKYTILMAGGEGSGSTAIARVRLDNNAGAYTLTLNAASDSSPVSVTTGNWYWVTVLYVRNGTCKMRVYDTGLALVGSEVTVAGRDVATYYFYIGSPVTTDTSDNKAYFDNWVCKRADVFPMVP